VADALKRAALTNTSDRHQGGGVHEPDGGIEGPTWKPTPVERLAEAGHQRAQKFARTDHTDTFLTLAACVLMISAAALVIVQQYRAGSVSQFSLLDTLAFAGQWLSRQFRLLVPALAALMIRSRRRPLPGLRMVLRVATLASAGCSLLYVGRVLTNMSTSQSAAEKRLLIWSAIGVVALVIANLAIVFDDGERLS
jgi:hypothetical protein